MDGIEGVVGGIEGVVGGIDRGGDVVRWVG